MSRNGWSPKDRKEGLPMRRDEAGSPTEVPTAPGGLHCLLYIFQASHKSGSWLLTRAGCIICGTKMQGPLFNND